MIGPRKVSYPPIDSLVRIPRPLGPKLPYRPAVTMIRVEKGYQPVEWVAVGALRVGLGGS